MNCARKLSVQSFGPPVKYADFKCANSGVWLLFFLSLVRNVGGRCVEPMVVDDGRFPDKPFPSLGVPQLRGDLDAKQRPSRLVCCGRHW
jgi:hypothetical protein